MIYLLIILATALLSTGIVLQNRTVKAGGDVSAIILINNLPGGLLLLLWCLYSLELRTISPSNLAMLLGSGIFWTLASYLRVLAYKDIDTSVGRIFETIRFVILATAGILIFSEELTPLKTTGVLITLIGIVYTIDFNSIRNLRGAKYTMASTLFAAMAIITGKYLSTTVPVELIVATDFTIPGLTLLLIVKNPLSRIKPTINACTHWILILPVIMIIADFLQLKVFSYGGEMVIVSTLKQTCIVFILGIEFFYLKLVPNIRQRCIAAALCSVGAVLTTIF